MVFCSLFSKKKLKSYFFSEIILSLFKIVKLGKEFGNLSLLINNLEQILQSFHAKKDLLQ